MAQQPIAVFDTGIGSYAIADSIRRKAMAQQVIYLADRASFPYGGKTRSELLESVTRAIRFLEGYRRSSIIVASNSPSVIVLKDLRVQTTTPLYGIVPPVREAVTISRTGHIGGSGNSIPH